MKLRVKQGSVKYNDTVYEEGQIFEIGEQGKSLLNAGIVEIVEGEEPVKKEAKKANKVEAKVEVSEVPEEEVAEEAEPSSDWTRKELNEHANGLGIKEPEKLNSKGAVLKAIKEVK